MAETTLSLPHSELALTLFGARDQHLRAIRDQFGVSITHRDGEIRISGDEGAVQRASATFEHLRGIAQRQGALTGEEVAKVLGQVLGRGGAESGDIDVVEARRRIRPRTEGQSRYVQAIRDHELVFALGPAGTGKTYLAVAMAVEALKNRRIRKIVLVRPAVEAGESLGYLPGDMQAKINPYLRPLLDALREMVDYDHVRQYTEQDVVEVIPLAYMRGRTLNDAFIILDEAQNTTIAQMKMFLTRMGEGSKIVVSGDVTQVDLPQSTRSGLMDAIERLAEIQGVAIVRLTDRDIVRHRLVQEIVRAYGDVPTRPPAAGRRGRGGGPAGSTDGTLETR